MKEDKRLCPVCGDTIHGRKDKQYCSDQCRVSFHNEQNRDSSKFMKNINNILRKNWRILGKLNPRGKAKVTKAEMLDEGFKFAYFTNEYITKSGKVYRFCYDRGYIQLEDGIYALVVRHEYIE